MSDSSPLPLPLPLKRLWGQDYTYSLLKEHLTDPCHLFITGPAGCGKTTLIEDFLDMFYKHNAKTQKRSADSILVLSSEKDRGIHTVREKVNDFCKRAPEFKGQLRWILFDDADSLPLISQQALRRPMETYSHLTKFIFVSRQQSSLIAPLRSRCYMIELEPVTIFDCYDPLFLRYGLEKEHLQFVHTLQEWFLCNFPSIHKATPLVKLVISLLKENTPFSSIQDILKTFKFQSEPLSIEFIKALVKHDTQGCIRILSNFFYEGFLLDDILLSLERSLVLFPHLKGEKRYLILKFIMRGWISIQQGKEYWLDTLDILFELFNTAEC